MGIQPTDLSAAVSKATDRDTAQQVRQGAPTGDDQNTLNQLAETARKQVRQKDHTQKVEPRRDANQDSEHGREKRKKSGDPDEEESEEYHFDALA